MGKALVEIFVSVVGIHMVAALINEAAAHPSPIVLGGLAGVSIGFVIVFFGDGSRKRRCGLHCLLLLRDDAERMHSLANVLVNGGVKYPFRGNTPNSVARWGRMEPWRFLFRQSFPLLIKKLVGTWDHLGFAKTQRIFDLHEGSSVSDVIAALGELTQFIDVHLSESRKP
jgi:hypothetical protein